MNFFNLIVLFFISANLVSCGPEEDYTAIADWCRSVSVDSSGNIYCAGDTNGDFGEVNGGGDAGMFDAFVMKFDSSGAIQWITQLGASTPTPGGDSSGNDSCRGVSTDSLGNVYCAGSTRGALGEANGGRSDAFVMKLDSSGNIQWLTQLGASTTAPGGDNSKDDTCYGVSVDTSGNVYCAGGTFGALGEGNGGSKDAFVMKLDSSGSIQWVTQLGASTTASGGDNSGFDLCESVSVDSLGNVYCAGQTSGALGEGNGGSEDAFVMKLDSLGNLQWVTQLGDRTSTPGGDSSQNDSCLGVSVDSLGNIYCAGGTFGALGEGNGGSEDAFVMKLDSSGSIQWVTQLGDTTPTPGGESSGADKCYDVSVDSSGNVYCAGYTGGALGEANGGRSDAFVMKLDSSGNIQWLTQLGASTTASGGDNSESDFCYGVSVDLSGNIYCAGVTSGAMGGGHGGIGDAVVSKFNSGGVLQWVTQLGGIIFDLDYASDTYGK